MLNYLITIQLRVPLRDDAEAREYCADGLLEAMARGARENYADGDDEAHDATAVTAKLQRLYDDRPPRLLAKWPGEGVADGGEQE
jgi:hypothetical protein